MPMENKLYKTKIHIFSDAFIPGSYFPPAISAYGHRFFLFFPWPFSSIWGGSADYPNRVSLKLVARLSWGGETGELKFGIPRYPMNRLA